MVILIQRDKRVSLPKQISCNRSDGMLVTLELSDKPTNRNIVSVWKHPYVDRVHVVDNISATHPPTQPSSWLRENLTLMHLINCYREINAGVIPETVVVATDRRNDSYMLIERIYGIHVIVAKAKSDEDVAELAREYPVVNVLASFVRDTVDDPHRNDTIMERIRADVYGHPVSGVSIIARRGQVMYPPFMHGSDDYLYFVSHELMDIRDYKCDEMRAAIKFHQRSQMIEYVYVNAVTGSLSPQIPGRNDYSTEFTLREVRKVLPDIYRELTAAIMGIVTMPS